MSIQTIFSLTVVLGIFVITGVLLAISLKKEKKEESEVTSISE